MSETVYVTNNSEKPLMFPYGGKELHFPVNQKVEIPKIVAEHIFGYGQQDKLPYLIALGLTRTTNDIPEGYKTLEKFVIAPKVQASITPNHSLSPVVESVPLPSKRGGGKFLPIHP